jgi:hypothetical protein
VTISRIGYFILLFFGVFQLIHLHCVSVESSAADLTATTLFTESFQDNNLSARGWYDNTNHGTIVSGGQSGNCLQWAWTSGQTTPANGGSIRKKFTPTDSLYVSFYVKFQSTWRGSQQPYHPHMIYIPSNLDPEYCPLASNYLSTYIEAVSDVGSPYTIRPMTGMQDNLRVNSSCAGGPPCNMTTITENRSVTFCNGCKAGADCGQEGICYNDGSSWYSVNIWKPGSSSIPTNQWVHVETYYKMNSISGNIGQADGVMKMWIDGVNIINSTNVVYRTNQDATKKWAQFVLAPYIGSGSPITQTMWIDELTVGTGEPNGEDPTKPSPPTNLRVVSP